MIGDISATWWSNYELVQEEKERFSNFEDRRGIVAVKNPGFEYKLTINPEIIG